MSAPAVLVTGASRGIGRHLVEHFLARDWRVFGCARGAAQLDHAGYCHFQADVTDERAVQSMLADIRARHGQLDVLVNNAGIARMLPALLTPSSTARDILDTNVLGTFNCVRESARLLRRSPCARVVNLSSIAVPLALEGEALYAASKSAVETLTRVLARELAPMGITCNAVGPSPIDTDLIRGVPADKLAALLERQALAQWATPADVANVVDFLVAPASRMVTGQVIYLGGVW